MRLRLSAGLGGFVAAGRRLAVSATPLLPAWTTPFEIAAVKSMVELRSFAESLEPSVVGYHDAPAAQS